ncbi:LytTR family transcriptional regulator [Sphingomonas sp. HMWF008]|nr:LytTR family transcriptional regulator [Sphingomonas sp. HMWF008]
MISARCRLASLAEITRPLIRWLTLALATGALLAALGPFGSYLNGSLTERAGYWIGAVLLGLLLYGSAYRLAARWTPQTGFRWWLALIAASIVASVPETLATRAAAFWLWPELARLQLPFLTWFAQSVTIGTTGMLVIGFLRRPIAAAAGPTRKPAPIDGVSLGPDVLALQMEDHYVRVHRATGSALILMPLGTAITHVEAEGLRTHRSWWVARRAVVSVEGNPRSMRLILSNGVVAPVARSAVTHLKAAGWVSAAGGTIGLAGQGLVSPGDR